MKIIKPGNVPERTFICDTCGCEFIANASEYTRNYVYDKISGRTLWETFECDCPYCGNQVKQN